MFFNIKFLRLSGVFALSLAVAACGFHLRGNVPLPSSIQRMYIQGPEGGLKDALQDLLGNNGAIIAPTILSADAVLNLREVISNRRVGTLDERGKVNSYNLNLRVRYSLDDPQGKLIRTPTKLMETRQYDFDPELVLESESEEAQLIGSMEEAIALRMIRQLATVSYTPAQGQAN